MAVFVKREDIIDYTPATAVECGGVVKIADNFYGVAHAPIEAGKLGALQVTGQYDFVAGGAVTVGADVYFADGAVSATSSAGAKIGKAVSAASSGETVRVLLNK